MANVYHFPGVGSDLALPFALDQDRTYLAVRAGPDRRTWSLGVPEAASHNQSLRASVSQEFPRQLILKINYQ